MIEYIFETDRYRCHKSKWVKTGNKKVFCSNSFEYENYIKRLDVYFGLGEQYEGEFSCKIIPKVRPELQKYTTIIKLDRYDNLIFIPFKDGDINYNAFYTILKAIEDGLRVGFGCAGGHGRTGWVLAKLIEHYEGTKGDKLVKEVRKRLCFKAIETPIQLSDLKADKYLKEKNKRSKGVCYNRIGHFL